MESCAARAYNTTLGDSITSPAKGYPSPRRVRK